MDGSYGEEDEEGGDADEDSGVSGDIEEDEGEEEEGGGHWGSVGRCHPTPSLGWLGLGAIVLNPIRQRGTVRGPHSLCCP